jgi:hypothetical protein
MSAETQHRRDCASVRHVMARQRADQLGNPNAPHRFGTPSAASRGIHRAGFSEGWGTDATADYQLEVPRAGPDGPVVQQVSRGPGAAAKERHDLARHPRYHGTGSALKACPRTGVFDDRFSEGALAADLYSVVDESADAAATAEYGRVHREASAAGFGSLISLDGERKPFQQTSVATGANYVPGQLDGDGGSAAFGGSAAGRARSARTDHAAVTTRNWAALPGGLRQSQLHPGATASIRAIDLASADSGGFRAGGFGQHAGPSATAGCDLSVRHAQTLQYSRAHATAGGITASRGSIIQ